MKVLMLNGSAKPKGNTGIALEEADDKVGVERPEIEHTYRTNFIR